MIRLYTSDDLNTDVFISLPEKQAHYLAHVMRLENGKQVYLFNGRDGTWVAVYQIITRKKSQLKVLHQIEQQTVRKPCILCPAVIKKENMDLVLQKATELGVTEIYPIITTRTVVRQFNLERAETIIHEACEQCERNDVPVIHAPQPLDKLLTQLDSSVTIIQLAERASHSEFLPLAIIPAFLIGPEGGFTEMENNLIRRTNKSYSIHLGTTILRAETAAIAVLASWQFQLFSSK